MVQKMKWLSALMVLCMIVLSACSSNGDSNGETASNSGSGGEKPYELNIVFPIFGGVPTDLQAVQDQISKLALEKINTTVKLTPINFGAWDQQTNLMLTSGEKIDLMMLSGNTYPLKVAKGQLTALDKLIEEHGQGIKKVFDPAYLSASKIDGGTYGVPSNRDLATTYSFTMRKDMVDKYKIDITSIKSLDDVEAVLKTIKESEPTMAPLIPAAVGRTIADSYITYDNLGDSFGVLPNFDNGLKVVNLYEMPEYAELLNKIHSWYKAGYILKDAATNKDSQFDLLKSNRGFGYLANTKPGFDEQESKNGVAVVSVPLTQPVATTTSITGIMWGIPGSSNNAAKAMQFLNLMYTDKEIVNLFDWGIEGKHFEKVSDNVIKFPQGVDGTNSGYNLFMGWLFGNQFLSYTFEGENPDIWSQMDEFNFSALKSKALGFIFDVNPVKTEFAAVTAVSQEFRLALETGMLDPSKSLPEFISKLKSAGIEKIIAEKQKQLDEWAKSSK
ncbi:ABC transporter substrate-binding protein [Paenibacillus sp. LPE1-1-1.1]|uniref:ABC transporter substrate-binding protein n=1 Tax=Paenibacillus sp. LPE1-1-1.1 TaxID=3135230 RepID=UPI003419681A